MKKKIVLLILLVTTLFIPREVFAASTADKLHFIRNSSTSADAIVVESNGHFGLIDTMTPGPNSPIASYNSSLVDNVDNGTKVYNYLKALGVTYLDFVVITHNHSDHNGGVSELKELVSNKTIVFYKEDVKPNNDYEEAQNWDNHRCYETQMSYFNSKNAIKCNVSNNPSSSINNGFITSVTKDTNDSFAYDTNLKHNLQFQFGDYNIRLYNLYTLSKHKENINSIVTTITHSNGKKAALMGDMESSRSDNDYSYIAGLANTIDNPVGTCSKCTSTALENQLADIIGPVDILKAGHHASATSNSYYMLTKFAPKHYIITKNYRKDDGIPLEYPYDQAVAGILYLRNYKDTDSYYTNQSTGAIVFVYNNSDYSVKIYGTNGKEDTNAFMNPIGSYIPNNGWYSMNNTNIKNKKWVYVKNSQLVIDWQEINNNWYYFDSNGIMYVGLLQQGDSYYYLIPSSIADDNHPTGSMATGWKSIGDYWYYFRKEKNDISEGYKGSALIGWQEIGDTWYYFNSDAKMATGLKYVKFSDKYGYYYLSEDESTIGKLVTGWKKVDGYWYYFRKEKDEIVSGNYMGSAVTGLVTIDSNIYYMRKSQNDISEGPAATMLRGLNIINGETYYFRKSKNEISEGPEGSALKNACIKVENSEYCFDASAHLTSKTDYIDIPTEALCNDITYTGNEQTLTSNTPVGYTYSNNKKTNAGDYQVTATLNTGYKWKDETNTTKKITCSIKKKIITRPTMSTISYTYTGNRITPIISAYDENTMDKEGQDNAVSVGDYRVTISLEDKNNTIWNDETTNNIIIDWEITKANRQAPIVNSYAGIYDGNYHTIDATGEGTLEYSTDQNTWSETKPTRKDLGTITVYVRSKEEANYNASKIAIATITITEQPLIDASVPTNSMCNNLTYTGSEQTLTKTAQEGYSWVNNKGTTAGIYEVEAELEPGYKWSDDSTGNKIINCEIKKVSIVKPTISTTTYTYTGSKIEPTISNFDENTMNKTGQTTASNVGNYSITISLKDKNNTEWDDNTKNNIVINWKITKASRQAPSVTSYTGYYDGNSHTVQTLGEGTLEYSTDQNTWSETKPTRTKVGTTTVYVRSKEEDNYNASEIVSGTITINEVPLIEVEIPTNDMCKDLTYNGSERTLTKTPLDGYTWSNNKKTNAGIYDVEATLEEGYKWSDNTQEVKTITCEIKKDTLVYPTIKDPIYIYTGNKITLRLNDFDEDKMSITGTTFATNVGEYNVTISLEDPINTEWENKTNYDYSFNWSISKAARPTPSVTSYAGIYDGASYTIRATGEGTFEYLVDDSTTWTETKPYRSEVGTTNVCVRSKEEDSYYASSIACGSITITEAPLIEVEVPTNSMCKDLTYNGAERTVTKTALDGYTFSDNKGTNAGIYIVKATLEEGYKWNDDTIGAKTIGCEIKQADREAPSVTSYTGGYDGNSHTIKATGEGTLEYSINKIVWDEEKPSRTNIGETTVYVRTKEEQNYKASEIAEGKITITEQPLIEVEIPTNTMCRNITYTGNEQTLTTSAQDGYIWSNNKGTNAGDYQVKATLKEGYKWNDDSTTEKTITCNIKKENRQTPTVTSYTGTYDGKSHTITATGEGTLEYSINQNTWSETKPTRTEVGTTTVYVRTKEEQNYKESEIATGTITIKETVVVKTKVAYTTHVQNIGWQKYVRDGAMAGTSGKSLRLEGIKIKLENQEYDGNVQYRTHIQNIGWEKSFKKNNEMSGTEGKSYRLEAIEIKLDGGMKEHYDIYYRVHAENFGWLGWARNGESAGTAGYAYRLEGIEIKLIPKGTSFPEYGKKEAYKDKNAASKDKLVGYTTHVQNIGWQKYVYDGAMAGTSGKSLRLEGIKIKLENQKYDGNILYRTHIQNIGWEKSFKKNNEMSGTEGKSYRLEGIEIKLDGGMKEHYDIYYRVHAENFGWLGWAKNGEQAGTAGYSYRLEGIEIKLVPKGEDFTEYGKKSAFKEKNSGIIDYDPNDAKIKNLIDNLTVGTSPGTMLELEFCNNKKVEAKDISTERAVKIASVVANKDNRETLTVTEMKNIVKKYLGKSYELNMNEVPRSTGHCGVMYYYDENKGLFIRANGGCGSTSFFPTRYKIVKAQDTNGTLKLDVKVVYTIISESNLSSYTVNFYSDYERTKLINSKSATEEPCQTIACVEERQQQYQASIEQDYQFDKGSTYQFTFKLENGNYVFVSSEKK